MNRVPNDFPGVLSRHADCTETLLKRASKLKRDELEFSTDAEAIRIRKMVSAVLGENHMMKAFVRLKPVGRRILRGYMRPEHDVWDLVGRFFARRFPGAVIVLGNNSVAHVFLFDGSAVAHSRTDSQAKALEELGSALGSGVHQTEELWDAYYWSQYRPEAKNTRYFRHNVRDKYARKAGIAAETDSGGTTLDDFIE